MAALAQDHLSTLSPRHPFCLLCRSPAWGMLSSQPISQGAQPPTGAPCSLCPWHWEELPCWDAARMEPGAGTNHSSHTAWALQQPCGHRQGRAPAGTAWHGLVATQLQPVCPQLFWKSPVQWKILHLVQRKTPHSAAAQLRKH